MNLAKTGKNNCRQPAFLIDVDQIYLGRAAHLLLPRCLPGSSSDVEGRFEWLNMDRGTTGRILCVEETSC